LCLGTNIYRTPALTDKGLVIPPNKNCVTKKIANEPKSSKITTQNFWSKVLLKTAKFLVWGYKIPKYGNPEFSRGKENK